MLNEGEAKISVANDDSEVVLKQARILWQKYFALTNELYDEKKTPPDFGR